MKPVHGTPLGVSAATMSAGLTGQGAILGTLQYMAPEQLEGKEVDSRADIWFFRIPPGWTSCYVAVSWSLVS